MKFIVYKNEMRNFDQVKNVWYTHESLKIKFHDGEEWILNEKEDWVLEKSFKCIESFLNSNENISLNIEETVNFMYFTV